MSHLGNSAFDLFDFFEMTPDLVCITGKDGYFRHVNHAVVSKLGYTLQELLSVPVSNFIHPDDKEITSSRRFKLLGGEPLINFQNRYLSKTGEILWLHWTSIFIPEKEVVFAIAKDVTAGKQTESQITDEFNKFKSLATHFKYSLERDRKYIALELHEELAQLAATVKVDLNWLQNNISSLPPNAQVRIDNALSVSGQLINAIRRMSYSLSPDMLEKLGLHETLKWLCDEFSLLHRIECFFQSSANIEYLEDEIKLDLFRICQEALSNVLYYAEADKVVVSIYSDDGKVCMSIYDNGPAYQIEYRGETASLKEIKERAASIYGNLRIESQPGIGTTLSVTLKA